MKISTVLLMFFVASTAIAAPVPTVRNMVYGGVESTHRIAYQPSFQNEFYLGVRGALNFLNFSNDQTLYYADGNADSASESFSFKETLGFGLSAGYQFARQWRADLDYVYSGNFQDGDSAATFDLSTQNITLGIIYTMYEWDSVSAYIGAGAGASFVKTRLSGVHFADDNRDTQNKTTYAAQFRLGLEKGITENFAVNIEYRLGYGGGMTNTRVEIHPDLDRYDAKIGGILSNSVMVGLRLKI